MYCQNINFSRHAIQQMFYRRISKKEVETVIAYGQIIEENPDDTPYPSYLILDFVDFWVFYFAQSLLEIPKGRRKVRKVS